MRESSRCDCGHHGDESPIAHAASRSPRMAEREQSIESKRLRVVWGDRDKDARKVDRPLLPASRSLGRFRARRSRPRRLPAPAFTLGARAPVAMENILVVPADVLAASVRMVNQAWQGLACFDCHFQRPNGQAPRERFVSRPTPTTRRECRSIKAAGYTQPSIVHTYVISPAQTLSGRGETTGRRLSRMSRSTRFRSRAGLWLLVQSSFWGYRNAACLGIDRPSMRNDSCFISLPTLARLKTSPLVIPSARNSEGLTQRSDWVMRLLHLDQRVRAYVRS